MILPVVFWTCLGRYAWCPAVRRTFEIRVSFSPTRLATEQLRLAYETVSPTVTRATEGEGRRVLVDADKNEKRRETRRRRA